MTITLPASVEAVDGTLADVEHGVHVECQLDAPFVIASCGQLLDWNERAGEGYVRDPMCERCLSTKRCPVCGRRLKSGGWR